MAIFNGTQSNDLISGTNGDDFITGLTGDDVINAADGDDSIDGGDGIDNILGGAGNDTIQAPDDVDETIDGGADDDTLITNLQNGDDLTQDADNTATTAIINGVDLGDTGTGQLGLFNNMEFVQVSNADNFTIDLTLNEDQIFAYDTSLISDHFSASSAVELTGVRFNGADGSIRDDDVIFDLDTGVLINGRTFFDGDTFTSTSGGGLWRSIGMVELGS